ncbi:MAG: glycosyltransferase, partial [Flavobacteriales bacterium]|nr:glycosyltransferase [Flavobacteriales bacterium]
MDPIDRMVSIVMPCRNEAAFIEQAVTDALAQRTRHAVEVIVAVGPGTDGTAAIVQRLAVAHPRVRMVHNPAGVVPHGLNAAIRAAHGTYIVRMDAHSRYPDDYVEVLVDALERTGADNVGGVWETRPANAGHEAWAIARALSSPLGVGNAMFRIGTGAEREVDTVPYGCFRRSLFDRIGFFDEELIRNQDDEHNGRIRRAGGRIVLLPQVRIRYYARDRIGKLWRMYREYGMFKPLVNIKLGRPATLRQFVPPLFVLGLVAGAVAAVWWPWARWAWLGTVGIYLVVLGLASLGITAREGRWPGWAWLVLAYVTMHVAYGVG